MYDDRIFFNMFTMETAPLVKIVMITDKDYVIQTLSSFSSVLDIIHHKKPRKDRMYLFYLNRCVHRGQFSRCKMMLWMHQQTNWLLTTEVIYGFIPNHRPRHSHVEWEQPLVSWISFQSRFKAPDCSFGLECLTSRVIYEVIHLG